VEITAAGDCALGSVLGFAGGHAKPASIDASWGMLLPLFQGEEPGKLREDVRTAEIRVALVGDVLREVARPLQRRESGGRAALAAQGSRRARPAVGTTSSLAPRTRPGIQVFPLSHFSLHAEPVNHGAKQDGQKDITEEALRLLWISAQSVGGCEK
jgi:hypothetical protein